MLWYIYALGCILLSRQIQTLKYYQGYSMLSPFTNQAIALTTSFAISPSPRTHFIFISTRFVMTDRGIYAFLVRSSFSASLNPLEDLRICEGNTVFINLGRA